MPSVSPRSYSNNERAAGLSHTPSFPPPSALSILSSSSPSPSNPQVTISSDSVNVSFFLRRRRSRSPGPSSSADVSPGSSPGVSPRTSAGGSADGAALTISPRASAAAGSSGAMLRKNPLLQRFLDSNAISLDSGGRPKLSRCSSMTTSPPAQRYRVRKRRVQSMMVVNSWDFDETQYLLQPSSSFEQESPRSSTDPRAAYASADTRTMLSPHAQGRPRAASNAAMGAIPSSLMSSLNYLRNSFDSQKNQFHSSNSGESLAPSLSPSASTTPPRRHCIRPSASSPPPITFKDTEVLAPDGAVLGITLDGVFDRLESGKAVEFAKTFLLLSKYWLRPSELLARLCRRFRTIESDVRAPASSASSQDRMHRIDRVRYSVVSTIQVWMESASRAFPLTLIPNLKIFVRDQVFQTQQIWSDLITKNIEALSRFNIDQFNQFRGIPLETLAYLIKRSLRFQPFKTKLKDYHVPREALLQYFQDEWGLPVEHAPSLIDALLTFAHIQVLSEEPASSTASVYSWQPPTSKALFAKPLFSKNIRPVELSLLDISSIELARQITLIDQWYFRRLTTSDLCRISRSKSKSLMDFIDWSNHLSHWASYEVVTTVNSKKRPTVFKHLLQVAEQLHLLHNFSSFVAIIQGLGHPSVSRLQSTLQALPKKYQALFHSYSETISVLNNFKVLRAEQAAATGPVVPYFAVFLRDITLLELSNPDMMPEAPACINWQKFQMLYTHFQAICRLQSSYHRFLPIKNIQDYLLLEPTEKITSELLHKKSRLVQPSAEIQ
ncbi:MAG: guanine nucleotide exchange factor [archaeon]|nr:guanine nucleotide exchange factor [archaeon]